MRFAGFAKSPQIGALWHFWTLTEIVSGLKGFDFSDISSSLSWVKNQN